MGLGIPYMGSKRKIAHQLVQHIASANPQATHFYDLFGGGGSMSFAALQSGFFESVHYNEINKAVVALLRKIQTDGVTEEFYQWISRERFFELIKGDDWVAGLAQTCWSFGNNQKGYLYSKARESEQKERHLRVAELAPEHGWREARSIAIAKERQEKTRVDIEHLERIEHLVRVYIQHLEAEDLKVTSADYKSVPIKGNQQDVILYCDIPYEETAEYKHGGFDHEEFYEWCRKSPHMIYISSYDAPFDPVLELSHRSLLAANDNSKRVVERLFCNKEEPVATRLF